MRKGQENLIPTNKMTKEQHLAMSSKGGRVHAQKLREKKAMEEDAKAFLNLPLEDKDLDDVRYLKGVKGKNITVQQAILLAMVKKAMQGSINAAAFIRDTAGEQVTQNVNVSAEPSVKLCDIIDQIATGKTKEGD